MKASTASQPERCLLYTNIFNLNRGVTAPATIDPTALERLHDICLHCGIRNRDARGQMRRYDPSFKGKQARY